MSTSDGRVQWLQHVVTTSLGATPRAFEYMLQTQDGGKKLMEAFLANEDGATPTLCFYASVMELSLARMVHGGKLSGDADEPEPTPAAPPPPEPEPAAAAEAPAAEGGEAAATAEGEAAAPAAEGAAAAEGGDAAAAPAAAEGEAAAPAAAEGEAAAAEGEAAAPAPAEPEPEAPPPPPKEEAPKRYQDPAELLMVHMCTPDQLTPRACVSRMVYFLSLIHI